ncbi:MULTISPECIES: hypothetical protein [unclassified Halomonas]|uniref:hypothetical protein n=1 Tax=unclassified Halomonas TaxID=2609666 RepID=UPI0007D9B9D9|nr:MULTISPECIES: hypothetical protein [unclassified Halomonas]MBT2789081.1 hypothetical protein [Halomonas sp. ISL-106]MBT2799586.1 hypothetical protein [Halomonas sp. ISL-104]OAL59689.1 hypothetical protein A6R74_21150 [Halomonas sp. ALS9]
MYFDEIQLLRWMKGDKLAVEYIEMICDVAHKWDDLIDKDKVLSDDEINKLFFDVLIKLPRNTFYRKNFEHLNSVLMNAISNWQIATQMEREGGDYEKSIAFILRSSYVDLITQAALLCGGNQWASKVGVEARSITHSETYEGYLKNLDLEKKSRTSQK